MNRHTKVFFIPLERLADVLSGRARVANLPADARCLAAISVLRNGVGVRVESNKFQAAPENEPLPVTVATIEPVKGGK